MTLRPFLAAFLGAAAGLLAAPGARAAEVYAADGIDLRWDNTLSYSNAIRISPRSAPLIARVNGDDGDRNFAPGLVSNRLDLLSQLDLSLGDFGFHASAAAWYDSVYHGRTDNHSPATYNVTSVSSDHFAPAVRYLHGEYAELNDAFVYGTFDVADIPLSLRLGRQTLLWGESLFYDRNSIASAQAPTDYTQTVTGQSSYGNDVYLPVTQLSLTAQLQPDIALTVYDQFEARPSRQPGDGSYFSYVDFLGVGAERLFLPSGQYLVRESDRRPSAVEQYGAALRASIDEMDLGIYALHYNATDPQIVMASEVDAEDPQIAGYYRLVYPKGISLYGASIGTSLGDTTVAGELSWRQDMPLLTYSAGGTTTGSSPYARYFRGDLLHAQTSAQISIGRSEIWDRADLSAEFSADDVAGVDSSTVISPSDPFAAKTRLLFVPHYFQVLPNLDLTFPIGVGYNLTGHSFSYYAQNGGTGDLEIGMNALYRSTWKASLMLTGFIGSPTRQPLADRNLISMRVERTF